MSDTVDTTICSVCGMFRQTLIVAPDTIICSGCGLARRPMDFDAFNALKRSRIKTPSIIKESDWPPAEKRP